MRAVPFRWESHSFRPSSLAHLATASSGSTAVRDFCPWPSAIPGHASLRKNPALAVLRFASALRVNQPPLPSPHWSHEGRNERGLVKRKETTHDAQRRP